MGFLDHLDTTKRELEKNFPGWHIWYVPRTDRTVTWCAQPWPLINSQSPEHLAAEITQAHTEAAADWPALAGIGDYADAAPGIIRPESI
jgi:hypothetical protein